MTDTNKITPKIVTIGGGTGTYVALTGLKKYPLDLTAIVSMMDSGGSTGRLRDQLGVLPPGDVRQALVALSESSEIWRKLFVYRFEAGDLAGHNFGNIFLSALEKITGSVAEAVELAEKLLQTNGNVVPITFSDSSLVARYSDGAVLQGEDEIDSNTAHGSITSLSLSPSALINLEAKRAIERAAMIVFGPGDLHTSILPNILVDGVTSVLDNSKALKVYVVNLMTKPGQTADFKASHFVTEFKKYLGDAKLDYILLNNKRPDKKILAWYREYDGADFVEDDLGGTFEGTSVIRRNLLSSTKFHQSLSDRVRRSLVRHDADRLGKALFELTDSRRF